MEYNKHRKEKNDRRFSQMVRCEEYNRRQRWWQKQYFMKRGRLDEFYAEEKKRIEDYRIKQDGINKRMAEAGL